MGNAIDFIADGSAMHRYKYLDKNALLGKNYYQLKIIDKDWQWSTSNIIELNNLSAAPN